MKKSLIILITCMLALSMCACSVNVNNITKDFSNWNIGDASITDKVESIEIDWASGHVNVAYSDNNAVTITETSSGPLKDEQKVHWILEGTTLKIRYSVELELLSLGNNTKELTVTVPRSAVLKELDIDGASCRVDAAVNADLLDVDTASGDIFLTLSAAVKEMDLDTASGTMTVNAKDIEVLDVDTASGDLDLNAMAVGTMDFDSASGKLRAAMESFRSADIDTASGNVSLSLPAGVGFTLNFDTASGDFSSDFAYKMSGDTYSCGDGSAKLNVDTASGDLEILEKK